MAITNVPFSEAAPIIAMAATFEDEISAQMKTADKDHRATAVNAATPGKNKFTGMGAGQGAGSAEVCNICERTGHNARDCLQFMQREGVCGHWFMHSIGKYSTGCMYGSGCKKKHERPIAEPVENENGNENTERARQAKIMATATLPETNGGKPVLKGLQLGEIDQQFSMIPNDTGYWLCENKTWLQPETDDITGCTNCNMTHSAIQPCADGGYHSALYHNMALQLQISAVETGRPFRWISYDTQMVKDGTDAKVMTTMATRSPVRGTIFKAHPPTRAAAATGCWYTNAKKIDESCLYDSD